MYCHKRYLGRVRIGLGSIGISGQGCLCHILRYGTFAKSLLVLGLHKGLNVVGEFFEILSLGDTLRGIVLFILIHHVSQTKHPIGYGISRGAGCHHVIEFGDDILKGAQTALRTGVNIKSVLEWCLNHGP